MSDGRPVFAIDTVARTLATPMSRRRAIGVIAGTVLGGSVLRPWRARAAGINCPQRSDPAATKKCEAPGGAAVCVTPDYHCCNSTTCAQACRPWQRCTDEGAPNAGCSDTPALCLVPREGGGARTPFRRYPRERHSATEGTENETGGGGCT